MPAKEKPKFFIYRKPWQSETDRSVFCSYTDTKGRTCETWFSSPSDSIDHVDFGYIKNRWSLVHNAAQAKFVKRKYREMMKEFKASF